MVMKYELMAAVDGLKGARSAWVRGVHTYAFALVDGLDCDVLPSTWVGLRELLLNGADDWKQYSYGGCALVYDRDIAERLCTAAELRRNRNGDRAPNSRETWLDVQERALVQASRIIQREFSRLAARQF